MSTENINELHIFKMFNNEIVNFVGLVERRCALFLGSLNLRPHEGNLGRERLTPYWGPIPIPYIHV